jgi:hypothetical protein
MKFNVTYAIPFMAACMLFSSCDDKLTVEPVRSVEKSSPDNLLSNQDFAADDIIRVDYGQVVGYKFTLPRYSSNSTSKAFFSATIGKKYTMAAVQNLNLFSKIDFFCTYHLGTTHLMSPFEFTRPDGQKGVFSQNGAVNRQTHFSYNLLKTNDLSTAVKNPQFIKANFSNYQIPYGKLPIQEGTIYSFKADVDKHGYIYGLVRVVDIKSEGVVMEVFVNKNPL